MCPFVNALITLTQKLEMTHSLDHDKLFIPQVECLLFCVLFDTFLSYFDFTSARLILIQRQRRLTKRIAHFANCRTISIQLHPYLKLNQRTAVLRASVTNTQKAVKIFGQANCLLIHLKIITVSRMTTTLNTQRQRDH